MFALLQHITLCLLGFVLGSSGGISLGALVGLGRFATVARLDRRGYRSMDTLSTGHVPTAAGTHSRPHTHRFHGLSLARRRSICFRSGCLSSLGIRIAFLFVVHSLLGFVLVANVLVRILIGVGVILDVLDD